MIRNKYLNQLTKVFNNGFMTYPQFEISYFGDQQWGTIGMFDWDKNQFTLNTKYEFYKEAKSALIKNNIQHLEGEMDQLENLYTNEKND